MASVRRELELLRGEVTDLVAVAEGHSELSSELVDRARSFESDAVKHGNAAPKSEQELKRLGLLGLIHHLETRRPYLTFKFILDAATSEAQQMFSREEAKLYLSTLIGEGALQRYQRGNIKALRLNPKHPRVKALVRPSGKSQESST